jgi:glycosyltransferase involved in cell wall biosynthesis
MKDEIILSLCIPTYNRATYLNKCLHTVVREVGNNASVEIIISDNVSDDNTPEVVAAYMEKYSNVKYIRNETNIGGDKNFIKVLTCGNGKYLKLLNDYVEFKEGAVVKILEIVTQHLSSKEVLFFPNGVSYLKRKDFHYTRKPG